MSPEQEPQTELDKSIDPEVLVVQQGENIGAVDAVEFNPEQAVTDLGEGRTSTVTDKMIEGLPIIGAEAEDASRSEGDLNLKKSDVEILANRRADLGGMFKGTESPHEAAEILHDYSGTQAMAAEVSRRAMELVPFASEELKKAVGEQAAENFKKELEAKENERHAAADAEAQALLDRLKGGALIADILPEVPETVTDSRPSIAGTEWDISKPTS